MNLLERASQIIEERGWCQETEVDAEGRVCLYGALHAADDEMAGCTMIGSPEFHAAREYVIAELADRGVTLCYPAVWNDRPGREAYEVAEVLRFAGKRMDEATRATGSGLCS